MRIGISTLFLAAGVTAGVASMDSSSSRVASSSSKVVTSSRLHERNYGEPLSCMCSALI